MGTMDLYVFTMKTSILKRQYFNMVYPFLNLQVRRFKVVSFLNRTLYET